MIPDCIREQVLNAKPPDGCCVPGGSVPAVAEGHFTFARAAIWGPVGGFAFPIPRDLNRPRVPETLVSIG